MEQENLEKKKLTPYEIAEEHLKEKAEQLSVVFYCDPNQPEQEALREAQERW